MSLLPCGVGASASQESQAFIDIRLLPGVAMSFIAVAARCSLQLSASRPLRPNVTSSIKPEVRNIAQSHHRRTEPPPQGMCTKHFVKVGLAVPEICSESRIDKVIAMVRVAHIFWFTVNLHCITFCESFVRNRTSTEWCTSASPATRHFKFQR